MSSEYVACETCGKDRLHYHAYVQGQDECPVCLAVADEPDPTIADAKTIQATLDWLRVDDLR